MAALSELGIRLRSDDEPGIDETPSAKLQAAIIGAINENLSNNLSISAERGLGQARCWVRHFAFGFYAPGVADADSAKYRPVLLIKRGTVVSDGRYPAGGRDHRALAT